MQVLRTPNDRFAGLDGYAFAPHYSQVTDATTGQTLRIHHIDEGPRTAAPILLLHGEPSWSYLYRNFVGPLADAGHRVIAPDLIGFGKSDKPADRADYSFERHVEWMSDWLTGLDLTNITLFCQDWGGLIGLRLVAKFPDRFARLVIANTGLPTGTGSSPGFDQWLKISQTIPNFPVGNIVNMGSSRELSSAEIAAYDAPFPDETYKEGARQFPMLVPVTPEHASVAENIAAWKILEAFPRPVLTTFSDNDPVTKGGEVAIQARFPGAAGQPHVIVPGGHFLQEDSPERLTRLILDFIAS
ncbi:haloalkane dehalogenase [Polymorphobacter glacialis]|uniref:Haloalkane dehalogenase n=1 Tax=Sandarakinorhabdus glacialis TaxID=1614636 RepID=A0A916ZHF1_9SPHN|nr:haloalkane dehalogenase [Polymorphobacter glacialis]GGD98280.1 haloalkane dehalogenase [Polymorphobacter glacialis]